jgi:hypothetical protein
MDGRSDNSELDSETDTGLVAAPEDFPPAAGEEEEVGVLGLSETPILSRPFADALGAVAASPAQLANAQPIPTAIHSLQSRREDRVGVVFVMSVRQGR